MDREYPGFVNVADYMVLPHNPATWIVKNLLPISGAALVYGLAKTGKSAAVIQLAAALSGGADEWLGFPIVTHGRVLYLQLDTPRSTWRLRFDALERAGIAYVNDNLLLADRECLAHYPFDISKTVPYDHMEYLHNLVQPLKPTVVVIDTLRKVHSLDEDNSTAMSNVVSRLIGAVHPAALILVSHSRKPNQEGTFDLMADHRGSGSVVGEMDAVLKLTKTRLYYGGRSIEEGDLKLDRQDKDDILLWSVRKDEKAEEAMVKVLTDTSLISMQSKAKALAPLVGITEAAAMSRVRRAIESLKHPSPPPVSISGFQEVHP